MVTVDLYRMKERMALLEAELRKLRPTESASTSKHMPEDDLKSMMEEILRTLLPKYLRKHSKEVNIIVNKDELVKKSQSKKRVKRQERQRHQKATCGHATEATD